MFHAPAHKSTTAAQFINAFEAPMTTEPLIPEQTVYVGERRYSVNLNTETVWAHVFRKCAWRRVRVTSRRIETAAILRASDQYHSRNDNPF